MDESIIGSLQSMIIFLATIVVALLIAQTILVAFMVAAFRKWTMNTSSRIEAFTTTAIPTLQSLRALIEDSRNRFQSIGANLEEISALARRRVQHLDGVVNDATDRAHMQLIRLDGLVSDTISKVEETTETLQRGVVKPVREITAVVSGVRAAVDFFRHHKRGPVEHATQDEEMFI